MAPRKYNEFLEVGPSDDEASESHDSGDAHETKGRRTAGLTNSSKKQKTGHHSSGEGSDDHNVSEPEEPRTTPPKPPIELPTKPTAISTDIPDSTSSTAPTTTTTKLSKPTSKKPTTTSTRPRKPGVIYLSRIPPFMRPSTVRHLLTPFGPITKLFLTPEPPSQHTARVRSGGNKKRSFIDGWVEFGSHKSAKTCVAAINGQTMGGRGWYRDDVWNARYLRGFGWDDLMEGVRAEEREREERVRVGVRRERKEREEFLRGVERAKVEEGRRRKREGRGEEVGVDGDDGMVDGGEEKRGKFERRFRQNEVRSRGKVEGQSEDVSRVLSKIF
ncbi:MAG: hypothetical protein L6R36_005786 [Xanthoria steineri]|nr:MAG: hypothetical protein L6R36_005786 [Xanthoria steineri]